MNVSGFSIDASCLMLVREVAEGLVVEADGNYTVALDLKITHELRQSCIARELVNRIQNHRKEMDLHITDRIRISVRGVAGAVGAGECGGVRDGDFYITFICG